MADRAPAPIPEGLPDLIAFTNTVNVVSGDDDLGTPNELRAWLSARGLSANARITPAQHKRALEVREALRDLAGANAGDVDAGPALKTLNREGRAAPLTVRFRDSAHAQLAPAGRGIDAFIAALLGTVRVAIADGTWSRVKACHNDECRWLFFDRSRNRSRTWCDMSVCGNVMKARTYRRKRARRR